MNIQQKNKAAAENTNFNFQFLSSLAVNRRQQNLKVRMQTPAQHIPLPE
jgi:hypothetical protein